MYGTCTTYGPYDMVFDLEVFINAALNLRVVLDECPSDSKRLMDEFARLGRIAGLPLDLNLKII